MLYLEKPQYIWPGGYKKGLPERACKVFVDKYYNNRYTCINSERDGFPIMTKSFILIDVDEDSKEVVKDAIGRHPAVSSVYTVLDGGDEESIIYDIVVKVEADTRKDLDDAESEIRTRKEVRSTLTLEVMEKDDSELRSKNKSLQI